MPLPSYLIIWVSLLSLTLAVWFCVSFYLTACLLISFLFHPSFPYLYCFQPAYLSCLTDRSTNEYASSPKYTPDRLCVRQHRYLAAFMRFMPPALFSKESKKETIQFFFLNVLTDSYCFSFFLLSNFILKFN